MNIVRVKYLSPKPRNESQTTLTGGWRKKPAAALAARQSQPPEIQLRASNNCRNINIHYWSWNYRGCWHQTCPPIDTHKGVYILFIPITRHGCPVLLFLVTTSLCQDWVICAPAAFLRCGSRFSGSLSGIKPWFSATRHCQGRPIPYHRKLISQKLEWVITNWCHTVHKVSWITKNEA